MIIFGLILLNLFGEKRKQYSFFRFFRGQKCHSFRRHSTGLFVARGINYSKWVILPLGEVGDLLKAGQRGGVSS